MAAVPEVRVGAVLDPGTIPLWQRTLLEDLGNQPGCSLAVWGGAPSTGATGPGPSRLFRRYERWDRERFEQPDDTLALVEPPALPDAPSSEQPDLVLWLTERPLPERSPEGVRHGIWFVRQGSARADREAPLYPEVRAGEGIAVTSLCALMGDQEHVLASSTGPADRVSLHRSRAQAYARAALLPIRALSRLDPDAAPTSQPPVARPKAPSAAATAGLIVRIAARLFRRRVRSLLFDPRWVVAYRRLDEDESPLSFTGRYRTLLPPPGRAFADPFVMEDPSGDAMLLEDYKPRSEPGRIVAVGLDPSGSAGAPEPVLSRDTHLSYPFLMRDEGQLYMVPESRATGEVELLRATDFPLGWARDRVLMEGLPGSDATLFGTRAASGCSSPSLPTATRPWTSSTCSPRPPSAGSGPPTPPTPSSPTCVRPGRPGPCFTTRGSSYAQRRTARGPTGGGWCSTAWRPSRSPSTARRPWAGSSRRAGRSGGRTPTTTAAAGRRSTRIGGPAPLPPIGAEHGPVPAEALPGLAEVVQPRVAARVSRIDRLRVVAQYLHRPEARFVQLPQLLRDGHVVPPLPEAV